MKKIAFASLLFAPSLLLALSTHVILKATEEIAATQDFEWLLPIEEKPSQVAKTDPKYYSAAQINSYDELTSTIHAGKQVTIVLDLAECTATSGMPTGFFSPSTMMLVPAQGSTQEHFATSHLHFTDHNGVPAYEYIKYTFNADGSVIVHVAFYDPKTFRSTGSPHTINCSLGKGVTLLPK